MKTSKLSRIFRDVVAVFVSAFAMCSYATSISESEMIDFASGTGALIDKSHVLTACHVVYDADEIVVEIPNHAPIKASVEQKNAEEDWALLRLEAECDNMPVCHTTDMQLGDRVYTLGFPSASLLGKSIKYTDGSISALTGIMDNEKVFQFSAPIQPGNSGGPIFDGNGRMVGVVLSCLDPSKFYQHTGGALPQAVNFGLKIQNVVSKVKGVSFAKGEERTVTQNHQATCFIRTKQKVSLDKPSVNRSTDRQTPSITISKKNSDFDYSKVSQRYRQLARYLENVANGVFATLGGDALDATTQEGMAALEDNVEKANKFLIIEGLSLVLYNATELTRDTIDNKTLALYSNAKDALWDQKKKNGMVKTKWEAQTFWDLRLRWKVEDLNGRYIVFSDSSKKHIKSEYFTGIHSDKYLAGRNDWPVSVIKATRYKDFRMSDRYTLIASADGILVGIDWQGPISEAKPKEVVALFEKKYNIHFKRKLPDQFSGCDDGGGLPIGCIFNPLYDSDMLSGRGDNTPYAYEDDYVRIYISAREERVFIILNDFENIIKQGRLKVEQEQLESSEDIPGYDSL